MAFVNEFVSEEDVARYKLDDIKREANPQRWRHGRPKEFRHAWTIDRDLSVFLMYIGPVTETGADGEQVSNDKERFLLNVNGKRYSIILRMIIRPSETDGVLFGVDWKLISIVSEEGLDATCGEVITLVKAAVCSYGDAGIRSPLPVAQRVDLSVARQKGC